MRIAMVVPGGVDESGREHVIPALVWLIERLARQHDLFVYVLRYLPEPRSYSLRGATVRDLGRPAGVLRQYIAALAAMRRDGPFGLVHGMWAVPSGLVAAAVGRRLGIPAVVTCDSGEFVRLDDIAYGSQRHWRHRFAVAAATRLARRVTVCSEYQARLARSFGLRPEIIPIGADRGSFTPGTEPDGPPWRLLNVANLNAVKDHTTLLRAFKILIEAGLDGRLDIAGEDTLCGRTQALAEALGLGPRITFHGSLTTERLAQLYRHAHVFVLASRHEAAGVVALEAALCGLPIAGTAVGYVADWANDRAVAVPPADPPALADAVRGLLADQAKRRHIASEARRWALDHDSDWTADAFSRLYRSVAVL